MDISEILKTIENLSLSSGDQIKYLKKLGTYPSVDELAIEFNDAFIALKGRINQKLEEIESLNSLLDDLNNKGDTDIWNVKSLDTSPWEEIRKLAESILLKNKEDFPD